MFQFMIIAGVKIQEFKVKFLFCSLHTNCQFLSVMLIIYRIAALIPAGSEN